MHHQHRQRAAQLHAEVPVGHAVQAVGGDTVHSQRFGDGAAVGGVGGAGERAASQRRHVHPFDGVRDAAQVAQQHHRVRHQLVTERDRLGALQMRIARHDGGAVRFGLRQQRVNQRADFAGERGRFVPQVEPDVERDLVVAAAGGVQPFADVADAARQFGLHEHMNVLRFGIDLQRAGFQVAQDGVQRVDDPVGVGLGDDVLHAEHGGVRHRAADVLPEHPAVEVDGRIEVVGQTVERFGKPACPHFFHGIVRSFHAKRGWDGLLRPAR